MTVLSRLRRLAADGSVRQLDWHFARFMAELEDTDSAGIILGACLASAAVGRGSSCLRLSRWAGQKLASGRYELEIPGLEDWQTALRAAAVVGVPGEHTPLVFDGDDRLYLARYWQEEELLAKALGLQASRAPDDVNEKCLELGLERLFPGDAGDAGSQRAAAAMAVRQSLAVISGGAGTGKTHTVARILALLAEQSGANNWRALLAAPTGKAAARLAEAVRAQKDELGVDTLPESASTLHRLLGYRDGDAPRYHAGHPLEADVVVVDEASMVDLPMMRALVDAIASTTRLILLGDKDQLSSVEVGTVLGDICVAASSGGALESCVQILRESRRFADAHGIGQLAAAINAGDGERVLEILYDDTIPGASLRPLVADGVGRSGLEELAEPWSMMNRDAGAMEVLVAQRHFRVLCAVREGRSGLHHINAGVERELRYKGKISGNGRWYAGQPLLIRRNDYSLQLFNGEIGVVLPDPERDGELSAFFAAEGGAARGIAPALLPAHDPAYALTVHQSQGSEFDRVVLVLPPEGSRMLSRELLYTACTRARQQIEIWASEQTILQAVAQQVERASGLELRLA